MNAIAQTANVETIAARRLAHKTDNFSIDLTEGKTQAAILTEIKDANYNIGTKSLAALMKGEKSEAGDFMIVGGSAPAAPAPTPAPEVVVTAAPAPTKAEERAALKAKQQAEKEERIKAAQEAKAALADMNKPAAAPVVAPEAPAAAPAEAPVDATATPPVVAAAPVVKVPRVLKDHSALLPAHGVYMPLRKDSVMDQYFTMLCRPEGATKKEMMDKFGWSAGGLSGIIGWEPKKKGYHLASTKVEGVLTYHLEFHANDKDKAGQRVTAADLTYVQPKPAPEPKTPKAPKVAKAATEAGTLPAGGTTRRVSAKKQAELDAAAAAATQTPPAAPAVEAAPV